MHHRIVCLPASGTRRKLLSPRASSFFSPSLVGHGAMEVIATRRHFTTTRNRRKRRLAAFGDFDNTGRVLGTRRVEEREINQSNRTPSRRSPLALGRCSRLVVDVSDIAARFDRKSKRSPGRDEARPGQTKSINFRSTRPQWFPSKVVQVVRKVVSLVSPSCRSPSFENGSVRVNNSENIPNAEIRGDRLSFRFSFSSFSSSGIVRNRPRIHRIGE